MNKSGYGSKIQHEGTVKEVGNNSVLVTIISGSACSGCHAESICSISGKEEKIVDIKGRYDVTPGDAVTVMMEESKGYLAVILSYLVPLVIVIAGLVILSSFLSSEAAAGLLSISLLLPYFIILYLLRNRINRSFSFTLKI